MEGITLDAFKEAAYSSLNKTIEYIKEAQQQIMNNKYDLADNSLEFASSGCADVRQFLEMSLENVIGNKLKKKKTK